ncbi:MAG: hypothetical protein EOL97_14905 [Spirochaetia bacterium]|nr:hypothetical protein [Spirochaetia bacterium]
MKVIEYVKENYKAIIIWIAIGLFIYFVLIVPSIKQRDQEAEQKLEQEREKIEENNKMNEIASEYNAVIFNQHEFSYSKDVQNNKNYLLEGSIHDIYQENGIVYLMLYGWNFIGKLEINSDQEKSIREIASKEEISFFGDMVIIAEINSVKRGMFENNIDEDLIYRDLSDDFFLRGKLISIKSIR